MSHHLGLSVLFAVGCIGLAHAQTLDEKKQAIIHTCIAERGQSASVFCTCLVNNWANLWSDDDLSQWSQYEYITPHMSAAKMAAEQQCAITKPPSIIGPSASDPAASQSRP